VSNENHNHNNRYIAKPMVLEAISGTHGIMSDIAKKLDSTWDTARKYVNKWSETAQAFQNERERITDLAENVIITGIKSGDKEDSKFWLKTIGKSRGFVEKQQQELSGDIVYKVQEAKFPEE